MAGVYVASEEEGSNEVNLNEEEYEAADLSTLDGWNHHTLALNVLGRVKPNPPKLNADGEEVSQGAYTAPRHWCVRDLCSAMLCLCPPWTCCTRTPLDTGTVPTLSD